MTNFEKFEKELIEIDNDNCTVAVDKKTRKPCACIDVRCDDCLFYPGCNEVDRMKWAMSEYEPIVDWTEVKDNTLIRARQEYSDWVYRYFSHAKYDRMTGKFHCYVYPNGIDKKIFEKNKEVDLLKVLEYKYCELVEEE